MEKLVNIDFNIISYINEKYIVETTDNGAVLIFVKNRVNRLAIEVVLENVSLLQIVIVEVIHQNLLAVSQKYFILVFSIEFYLPRTA